MRMDKVHNSPSDRANKRAVWCVFMYYYTTIRIPVLSKTKSMETENDALQHIHRN